MIEELCSKLKEKRKELGLGIEEVVEKTKLYPSVIRDIEGGNLSNISPTYLKGFIKIYASFLGVDIGDSLNEISSSKLKAEKIKKIRKSLMPIGIYISPRIKKIVIIFFLWIFILASFIVITQFIIKKIPQLFKKSVKKNEEIVTQIPIIQDKSKEIKVSLLAKRKCFLKVKVDGRLLFEGILEKDIADTWKGHREIELKINDASAIFLEVNGNRYPPLATLREPKTVKITPSGISVNK